MAEQRLALWNAEEDLEEEVELSMAIGSYGPSVYDDGENCQIDLLICSILSLQLIFSSLQLTKQLSSQCSNILLNKLLLLRFQMSSKASGILTATTWFYLIRSQFIVHFHQAVLDNNLVEITVAYESGWNKYTEKFYSRTEWPEAELIAPLVNDGA